MDICCRRRGEPWDACGIADDFLPHEAAQCKAGDGCPSCNFGTTCTACGGTDKEPGAYGLGCDHCHGHRSLLVWEAYSGPAVNRFPGVNYGCRPNVRQLTDAQAESMRTLKTYPVFATADGNCKERLIACPFCLDTAPACGRCEGTGKFQLLDEAGQARRDYRFLESADEALDDFDPVADFNREALRKHEPAPTPKRQRRPRLDPEAAGQIALPV